MINDPILQETLANIILGLASSVVIGKCIYGKWRLAVLATTVFTAVSFARIYGLRLYFEGVLAW